MTPRPAPGRQPAAVASLPMYDLPEVREATDELWGAIAAALARRGVAAPPTLSRSADPIEHVWTHPDLVLSQTCGYPLVTRYRQVLTVVGTPRYAAPGCEGPFHRAVIVVRTTSTARAIADLRNGRCAVNDAASNTGMNLLRAEVSRVADGAPFFSEVIHTGSHAMSLWSVAEGEADVASIDAVTLELLQRHRPAIAQRVRALAWTAASPALPFVTRTGRPPGEVEAIRSALAEAVQAPGLRAAREALLLDGVVTLPMAHYDAIARLARDAADRGYPELR